MSDTSPGTSPPPPPGWYPAGDGTQRYWDGSNWTEHIAPNPVSQPIPPGNFGSEMSRVSGEPTSDERNMATLAHILGLLTGFVGPLIIWLIKKDESGFVNDQGKEALNFQITMVIAWIVSFILAFVLIGFVLMALLFFAQIILPILAAVSANRGEAYRYPFAWRIIT